MVRIFSIILMATVLMIGVAGGGTYWLSQADINDAKHQAIKSLTQGIAQSISSQLKTLQQTVDKMAKVPEVMDVVKSENPQQMAETALMLEQFLPKVLKIRILPAEVIDLDQSVTPHMGNADLIMAQATLARQQRPAIQGQGVNRHLAVTSVIKQNDVAIGIVLASLKYDFLSSLLKSSSLTSGVVELKQDNTLLATVGSVEDETVAANKIRVADTSWDLHYRVGNKSDLFTLSTFAGVVIIPILLSCLIFFICYRNLSAILRQDLSTVLKAIKDLMSGKSVGSYPVNLNEMKTTISTLVQYKRILGSEGEALAAGEDDELDMDDFFDEPDGVSFLDMNLGIEDENNSDQSSSGIPISFPDLEDETEKKADAAISAIAAIEEPVTTKAELSSSIYRAYDIRGIAGETLTTEITFNIGRAVASEAKEKNVKTIVMGRDGRTSSPSLADSLAQGIISTGINVFDIGLVPSPLVYFVAQHTEGKSGVVITGSHNPAEYNGVKIMLNGETFASEKIQQLEQRIKSENYLTGEAGSVEQNTLFINEYIGMVSEDIHIARPMKVVVDCGNGATGEIAPTLLKTLGCEVIELFCEIDGTFPNHHPDPSKPENLSDLIAAVQHYQADIGIAFDGDGDRLGVVDSAGKIIWADRQMMLYAKHVLAVKPGSEVIFDVKCSRHLVAQITKSGGRPLMWKTGHSFMKAKLLETGAVLAGELSGHIFFNDRWFGFDDALYAASRLIEILSIDTRSSADVFADFPDSVNTPEINVELEEGENVAVMKQLLAIAHFDDGKKIEIDGLRVEFSDGWGLVRASNTMPSLVLRFEADNVEALDRIQTQFKECLTKVKSDINIPF